MIDKTNTNGLKLYIGGQEVTKEDIEKAMSDYNEKVNSPEYQAEVKAFGEMLAAQKNTMYRYFKLPLPPHTIFKLDKNNFTSYKFDETKKCWIEFPEFFTDFEYGNIRVEEIKFNDEYPVSSLDQNKGMHL